ncbi:MBL fold metallo-hydrolase [Microvirga sp. 2MCAF38]|uniref:MBL fold metallo-hydrolase n=1 Tax=Microvirga sp. 2MCAF38 TaxID=3232989 RepID=UPI003F9A1A25
MNLRITILGCGSSGGVPRVGSGWGACDPENPRNRRRRCSILVEEADGTGTTRILVDTSPDLREQLLDANVKHLDAVLFTHQHADHTHGIDDLRPLVIAMRSRIPVYADRVTSELLLARFGYCFDAPPGSSYPPILEAHLLKPGLPVHIQGAGETIEAQPFHMVHGDIDTLGFRFNDIAYAPDVSFMPEESIQYLENLDVLIIDALRYTPHPTHFSVSDAMALIERVKPKRAILTNLHSDLDYDTLGRELPPHVQPAFDGMVIEAN